VTEDFWHYMSESVLIIKCSPGHQQFLFIYSAQLFLPGTFCWQSSNS